MLQGTLSTGDTDGVGPNRSAPDNGVAPAGQSAAAGGQVRPRGRRFSDRGRPVGQAGAVGPASRRRADPPAELPRAEALDAITLTSEDASRGASTVAGDEAAAAETVGLPSEPGVTGIVARVAKPAWPVPADHRTAVTSSAGPERAPAPSRGDIRAGGPLATAESVGAAESDPDAPPVFLVDASRAALTWARRRYLGLSSACGISVALAGCAAVWFSAGTTSAVVRGVVALWASYLVLAAGRTIAAKVVAADGSSVTERRQASPVAWLAALGGALAEAVVYSGLVAGAAAQHWPGSWKLGVTALGLVAVRNVMTACSTPYGFSFPPSSVIGRIAEATVTMPAGGRVLVIGVVAPIWGVRTALLVVIAWAISSIGFGLAGRAAADVVPEGIGPAGGGPVAASATLLRLRDDGALARGLGALVRGNLLPLPPAILSLAAVSALAVLGLHGLPGALTIGPAIVMLLAAPGSANPHAGRFDWLVPVLLLGTQVLYLAAVGEGQRVPGPVVFALIAALLLRYAELASPGRPVFLTRPRRHLGWGREYGTELGWEGRVLLAGLAAALGIATAGYLALTVYLVVLVGAKVVRSCLAAEDGLR
jgi:hypothetical protein